jgi:hypothetical protein
MENRYRHPGREHDTTTSDSTEFVRAVSKVKGGQMVTGMSESTVQVRRAGGPTVPAASTAQNWMTGTSLCWKTKDAAQSIRLSLYTGVQVRTPASTAGPLGAST